MLASDIESVFSLKVIIYASCALLNGYFWRFVYFIYSCAFEYLVKKNGSLSALDALARDVHALLVKWEMSEIMNM